MMMVQSVALTIVLLGWLGLLAACGWSGVRWNERLRWIAWGLACTAVLIPGCPLHNAYDAIVILDQSANEVDVRAALVPLMDQLRRTGCQRCSLLAVDTKAAPKPPAAMVSLSGTTPAIVDQLAEAQGTATNLDTAIEAVTAHFDVEHPGILQRAHQLGRGLRELLWGDHTRVVVGLTDPQRWQALSSPQVSEALKQGRKHRLTFHLIELEPIDSFGTVELQVGAGAIAAGRFYSGIAANATIVIRSPKLRGASGSDREVELQGWLNGDQLLHDAALPRQTKTARISDGGVATLQIPLNAFVPKSGNSFSLESGFARYELQATVKLGSETIECRGTSYVPVRTAKTLVVCGTGHPTRRLLQTTILDGQPLPTSAADFQALSNSLFGERAGSLSHFEFISEAEFVGLIENFQTSAQPLPILAVLHEMSTGFWEHHLTSLTAAVQLRGMNLLVIDPPDVRADWGTAEFQAGLKTLLPAYSVADQTVSGVSSPLTLSRDSILTFAFDYARTGRVTESAGIGAGRSSLALSLPAQVECANACLAELGSGLVKGQFKLSSAGDLVSYHADPDDRVVVQCLPPLTVNGTTPNDALVDLMLGSLLEFRLAALLPDAVKKTLAGDVSALPPQPAEVQLPPGDPHIQLNHLVMAFTSNGPQVRGALSAPMAYRFGTHTGSVSHNPDRGLAACLLSGMHVIPIVMTSPYDSALRELPVHWPTADANPFAHETATLNELLGAKLTSDLTAAGSAATTWPVMAVNARRRVLKNSSGAVPFSLDLADTTIPAKSRQVGKQLAGLVREFFATPRGSMALAASAYDRSVDGRIGPGQPPGQLAVYQSDATRLATEWPIAERNAAPRRFRALQLSESYPEHRRVVHTWAIDTSPSSARLAPLPMLVSGIYEVSPATVPPMTTSSATRPCTAQVMVMSYSPYEQSESWWTDVRDAILIADATDADEHGLQRMIDPSVFLGRVRVRTSEQAEINDVSAVLQNGALDFVADFVPSAIVTTGASVFALSVENLATSHVEPLPIIAIDWQAMRAQYRLRPEQIRALFAGLPTDRQYTKVRVNKQAGFSSQQFVIRRPDERNLWEDVDALTAMQALSVSSGGVTGTVDALTSGHRSWRELAVAFLIVLVSGQAFVRGWHRWRSLWQKLIAPRRTGSLPEFQIDAIGMAEEYGQFAAPPRAARALGELSHLAGFRPGDSAAAITRSSLLRLLSDLPTLLEVRHLNLARAFRLRLMVNVGPSMRLGKLPCAGAVCQLLAELAWKCGAEVTVTPVGLLRSESDWGPSHSRTAEDCLLAQTLEWGQAAATSTPLDLAQVEIPDGTLLILISDFLHEDIPQLGGQAAALAEVETRLAVVRISSAREFDQLGFGSAHGMLLDRTQTTTSMLQNAYAAHGEWVREQWEQFHIPVALMNDAMDEGDVLNEITESGLLDLMK